MALASFQNLTVAVLSYEAASSVIDGNKITGILGSPADRLLVHKKRNWILKYTSSLRDDNINLSAKNKTFAYMAQHKLADVYFAPDSSNYYNEYLEPTKTVSMDSLQISQFLPKPENSEKSDLSNFLLANINMIVYILIGYLLFIIFSFIVIRFSSNSAIKIFKSKFVNFLFFDFDHLLSFKFALLILFFDLFIFLNLNILTNFINTSKVVVKMDDFLISSESILTTKKKFSYLFNDEPIITKAPENSFLYRLYNRKVKEENNYLKFPAIETEKTEKEKQKMLDNIYDHFYLLKGTVQLNFISVISMKLSNADYLIAYLNKEYYYEFLKVFFVRRSLNEQAKKLIFFSTQQYFETGIYIDYYSKYGNWTINR